MSVAFLGLRGTGAFSANVERPKNWRQELLLQFPNGDAPLTALLSKLREEPTDDPEFSWMEKGLPLQRGIILGASETVSAAPANNTTVASGHTANMALTIMPDGGTAATSDVSWLKAGHILCNQVGNENYLVIKVDRVNNFVVVQRQIGGTPASTSTVTGNTSSATADSVIIVGSGNPEGATVGSSIAYAAVKYRNFTQICRTPLSVTRTARKTRLRWDRTGPYAEAQREALQIHGIEMEKALFFGERSEQTALSNPDSPLDGISSNTPLRTTRGLLNWMPAITTASMSIHCDIGSLNTGGLTEALWDAWLEELFRNGSKEKALFAGSTFINVLTQLAKNKSCIEMVPTDQTYGMAVTKYLSPFGALMVINHPLLSKDPVWRKDCYGIDVDKLCYRYITDTTFLKNRQNPGEDASKDEYLTEWGLECHFSGAAADSDSPNAIASDPAHGRLKGVATYAG